MPVVPTISLHGGNKTVTLADSGDSSFFLTQGATGLGWGPLELTTSPLASGGSVLRHRRLVEAEIMLAEILGAGKFYHTRFDPRTVDDLFVGILDDHLVDPVA